MQQYISLAKDLFTLAAIVGGVIWFYYRWEHGRRAQLDLDCVFFPVAHADAVVAEIRLTLENKGAVKQDVHGFQVSVHAPSEPMVPPADPSAHDLRFDRVLVPATFVAASNSGVRPGVRHLFTHTTWLRSPGPLVEVTVALVYDANKAPINAVKRVFSTMHATDDRRTD